MTSDYKGYIVLPCDHGYTTGHYTGGHTRSGYHPGARCGQNTSLFTDEAVRALGDKRLNALMEYVGHLFDVASEEQERRANDRS